MPKHTLDNQLCFQIYRATSQFTRIYKTVLQPFELTYPQYLVLLCLWEEDGKTSAQIGATLELGIGTINPIINKLCEKNWITKSPSTNDGRATNLSLTKKAQQQQPVIEQAIMDAMLRHEYLATKGRDLLQQLNELNTFLHMLNEEEFR